MSYKTPFTQKNYNPCANVGVPRASPPIARQSFPKTVLGVRNDNDDPHELPTKISQLNYNRELNVLKENIELRDKENSDLINKKIQMENEYNIRIKSLQNENSMLNNDIRAQEMQLSQFYSKLTSQLSRPITNLRDATVAISDIIAENLALQNKIEKLSKTIIGYDSDVDVLREKLLADKEEKAALKKNIKALMDQQKTVPDVNSIIQPYEKKIEILNQKLSDIQDKYMQSQRAVDEHESSVISLKEKIDKLQKSPPPAQLPDSTKQLYESKISLLQERLNISEKENQQKSEEIKKINELVNQNEAKIAELLAKNEILQNTISENEYSAQQSKDKINDLKKKITQANDMVTSVNVELEASHAKSEELELRVSQLTDEKAKLESQLEEQKSGQNSINQHLESENECLHQSLAAIENTLNSQREEISKLCQSRTILLNNLEKSENLLKEHEAIIESALQAKTKAEDSYDSFMKQISAEREVEDRAFNDAFDHVLDVLPVGVVDQVSRLNGLPKSEILRSTVDAILSDAKDLNSSEQSNEYSNLEKRHQALLEQLQYCVDFIRKITRSQINVIGQDGRTEILQQCARLGKFIDDLKIYLPNKEFARISIFDPLKMNNPENIAKLFFDYVDDSLIDQSPYVELYTLFCIYAQINMSLTDSAETVVALQNELKEAKQYSKTLLKQIEDLSNQSNEFYDVKEKLNIIIQNVVEKVTGDFETDFEMFTDFMTQEFTPTRVVRDLEKQLEEARIHVEESEFQNSHERMSYEREKAEFCEKVNKLVSVLEGELKSAKDQFNHLLHKKEEEDELYRSKIEELELQNAELSKISDNSFSEEKMSTVLDKLEKVTAEKKSIEEELEQTKRGLSDIIKQAHDDVQKLIDKLNREKAKVASYKSRALSAESKNSDVLMEVRKRTDSLASQYGTSIVSLQNDLKQEREKIEKINKEKVTLTEENTRLKSELSKLKLQLRTLSINNEDLKTNLETERSNNSAKLASLHISASSKFDTLGKTLNDTRNKFREGIAKITGFEGKSLPEDDDELIENAYKFVNDILNSETAKITQDALHLRKVLRLDGTDKHLSDVFSEMRSRIAKLDDKCSAVQSENERIQTQTERTMRDNERLQSSQEELLEWSRWGRSMFNQISDMSPNGLKDQDIRLTIEEQFLGSLGFGSLRTKLSILRIEKQFLLSHSTPGSCERNPSSIRPIAMVLVFSNILQGLSGTQSPRILIKEKKPAPKL